MVRIVIEGNKAERIGSDFVALSQVNPGSLEAHIRENDFRDIRGSVLSNKQNEPTGWLSRLRSVSLIGWLQVLIALGTLVVTVWMAVF